MEIETETNVSSYHQPMNIQNLEAKNSAATIKRNNDSMSASSLQGSYTKVNRATYDMFMRNFPYYLFMEVSLPLINPGSFFSKF